METKDDRTTDSFKMSSKLLGYILAALVGATGGAGFGSLRPSDPAPSTSQFVTREQFVQGMSEIRERLVRLEEKLDQPKQAGDPRRR